MSTTNNEQRAALRKRAFNYPEILGVNKAKELARLGRLITAIKYIEAANQGIPREKAKAIVNSFGYGSESRWPEMEHGVIRCL